MDWPKLNTPEDADATHRWARACLEMWKVERADLLADNELLRAALNKPLRDTILAVLQTMPGEAAPEHVAAMVELQVRAWQKIP